MDVKVADIFSSPTITDLIANIDIIDNTLEKKIEKIKVALKTELSDEVKTYVEKEKTKYRNKIKKYDTLDITKTKYLNNILLTGATGYLGVHVLKELLADSDKKIYCIIRGIDNSEAKRRLETKSEYYFGKDFYKKYSHRIIVLKGDLSEENLGMKNNEYEILLNNIESIIHTAANVSHYGEYEVFYKSNVLPVINLISLCKQGLKKDLHYISTRSVCDLIDIPNTDYYVTSDFDDVSDVPAAYHIYVKTKLEGEKVVIEARKDGINTSIYRVGNLVFNSETGKHQENLDDNGFYQTVKAYLNLGYVPSIIDETEMSYIDYTAKAICTLYDKENLQNEIFHAYNPYKPKLTELFSDQDLGLNIETVCVDDFFDQLLTKYDRKAFFSFIQNFMLHSGFMDDETNSTTVFVFQEKTDVILEKLGFKWKKIDSQSFKNTIYEAFKNRIEWFSNLELFKDIDDESIISLSKSCRLREVDKDTPLLIEGVENSNMYFITDGMLTESKKSYGGWEGVLRVLPEGTILGLEHLTGKNDAGVSVETMLGNVEFFELNINEFKKILINNEKIFENILRYILKEEDKLKRMIVALN
jgi:thioester reductase-like protein